MWYSGNPRTDFTKVGYVQDSISSRPKHVLMVPIAKMLDLEVFWITVIAFTSPT